MLIYVSSLYNFLNPDQCGHYARTDYARKNDQYVDIRRVQYQDGEPGRPVKDLSCLGGPLLTHSIDLDEEAKRRDRKGKFNAGRSDELPESIEPFICWIGLFQKIVKPDQGDWRQDKNNDLEKLDQS